MEYCSLGRTGVQVSPLCLGCMMFGSQTSPEDSYKIIDRAIDAGINFIDTANIYGRGRSEEVVGEALQRNGKRERVVLATKVWGRMAEDDPNAFGNNRRHIIQQCEASLRRLKTDYFDLYQIHRPQPSVPVDEALRAMDDLVRAGKVRYVGTSNFAAWQLIETLWASKELGLNRVVSEQPPYNLLDRRPEQELVPMALSYGIALIPWSPLAGGILTGKYNRDTSGQKSRFDPNQNSSQLNQQALQTVGKLLALAEEKKGNLSQLALAWCGQQPGITSPIIGPRTMEQLEDNLLALNLKLSDEDFKLIDEIIPPGRMVSPFFELDRGVQPFRW